MGVASELGTSGARNAMDAKAERLKLRAASFRRLPLKERIVLAESLRSEYLKVLEEAIAAGCRAKGLAPDSEAAGEEWLAHGFCVMRHFRLLIDTLRQLEKNGRPDATGSFRARPNGALATRAFPLSPIDRLAFPGLEAEIYFEPGFDARTLQAEQAALYRSDAGAGGVVLVLGAGNVASIPARDLLNKLFNEGKVVLLKLNPVNDYLGPFFERAFRPAIEKGFVSIVTGGPEEGAYLLHHPCVDEVHLTGSQETYDRIVWGEPGPEREERKRQGRPLLEKPVTAELGNISPVLVLPGPWSASERDYHARNIAGMVANNASFNCNAAKLLVTSRSWPGRAPLLTRLGEVLERIPTRRAYYPGAAERYTKFTRTRRAFAEYGKPAPGALPWGVVTDLDPYATEELFYRAEPWCSVLGETGLEPSDPVDPIHFLDTAVDFVNERVWGNLCVTLLVHPSLRKRSGFPEALERAIERLRYGTVALNVWPSIAFALGTTPWGAYGNRPEEIQSGQGWIGNTSMYARIEKTVVRAPFVMRPKPPWFADHRTLRQLGRGTVELERTGSWRKLPALAWAALRA